MLMGKNTLIRKVLEARLREPIDKDLNFEDKKANWTPIEHWEPLYKLLKGNVAIIFTNGELTTVKEIMERHQREAPARAGVIAQCDVYIKAGSTGLDPKQTAFFQQLNIGTKIVKSVIEIISDTKVCSKGDMVEPSHQVLLEKLHIRPFSYQLAAVSVIDNGKIFDAKVLAIKPSDILSFYVKALNNVAAVSLQVGYPTVVSV
jgi:large subunit ribosomal protein LP0